MSRNNRFILLSCEHGGNRIPLPYQHLFVEAQALLATHRGYDAGALALATILAERLAAPLVQSVISRLVVDLNRSSQSRNLFSQFTGQLDRPEKQKLLKKYYHPYRDQVQELVEVQLKQGIQVLHLSIHSFTPVWHGEVRPVEIGLLYDPARKPEQHFCRRLKQQLSEILPELRIRSNTPYRGTADGLVRSLRQICNENDYLGIELEINQVLLQEDGCFPEYLTKSIETALFLSI